MHGYETNYETIEIEMTMDRGCDNETMRRWKRKRKQCGTITGK